MLTAPQGCPWHSARRGVSHPAPSSSRVAILSRKMRAAVGLFLPIAAAILGCWWWLGAPVAMPPSPLDAGEKLFCVSYTPFRGNQTPLDLATRIDASEIELITVRHVRSRLDDEQAARLPPPQGTVVYSVTSMDEIGEALDERLGQMFGRPHWTRD